MVNQLITFKKVTLFILSTLILSFSGRSLLANDPFRSIQPRPIGNNTAEAFSEIFKKGNYLKAEKYLQEAVKTEGNEPLAHAIEASLAYSNEDWKIMKDAADRTLIVAKKLISTDLLRGHLYQAVGHFLQGAYTFKMNGPLGAVDKLQLVFDHLDKAEDIAPEDPEFNLLKGYLDLILSVNLPFSSPEDAISRFKKHAAPKYMVDRALFAAYRDLEEYTTAMKYIDIALENNIDNPELQYFKGQLLRKQAKIRENTKESFRLLQEAYNYFDQAMTKFNQLSKGIQIPLRHDHRAVQDEINAIQTNSQ